MVSNNVLALLQYRWNVPVLSHLHQHSTASFDSLAERMLVSRDALSRSLFSLRKFCWIQVRTAQSRRKYHLTESGVIVAPECAEILKIADAGSLDDLALRRWTLPVIAALSGWSLHFSELKAMLPEITPRSLAMALKDMQSANLVQREIIGGFPPSTSYKLTKKGAAFLNPLNKISSQ